MLEVPYEGLFLCDARAFDNDASAS